MILDIPEDISLQLAEMAQRQDAEIDELLRDMIKRYVTERNIADCSVESDGRYATWEDLLKSAHEAGLASPEPVDTAARSREILQTEYTDYLVKRRLDNDGPRR